jgi:hypothetical protein
MDALKMSVLGMQREMLNIWPTGGGLYQAH